ncbi:MAG: carboxypeptidase-like regulatory domain-containing protein, partial [Bacteroidota bacterium]
MKNLVLMFSCLMAMFVMSCGDDATVNPPGDGGIPGTIAGRVMLFDEYGDSLSNHSGVAVKLVNANKSYSATTDASGNYKLEKVIAGIYDLTFEKET